MRTSTQALSSWPTRNPQRLASTIRGTNPSTASKASWFAQSSAGGACCTSQNVPAARADIPNANQIARRVARQP